MTVLISALHRKRGLMSYRGVMIEELRKLREQVHMRIPAIGICYCQRSDAIGNVTQQDYEENDVLLLVELPPALELRLKNYIQEV